MKLWLNENDFVEPGDRKSLAKEIAPRSRSLDWMGIMGFLPDPDPILQKLGQDITAYKALLSDAHVWSCCQSRKSGILSCEWEVTENPKGSIRANKRAHQMIRDMMDDLDVYQIVTDILDAPFFGMSPVEVVWKSTGSHWLPDRIQGKPPEWFVFNAENELRFKSKEDMIEGEELPDYKFLLPRHHATYQNPYGERILSRCFWPVTFKKGGFKFWAIFTEKYGMPWVVGKVPRNTNETERGELLTNLASMVQDAVAVINDDEGIEIKEAAGKSASADIYEKLISATNREISKAILGQTLTTELDKGGSFAATKEHMEVRADLVNQDKRMVSEIFNKLFSWVTALNFDGAAPPVFEFYEEEDIKKDRAERDKILSEGGVRFTKEYYQREYNLEEGDFNIRPTEAGRPPPAPQPEGEFAEKKPGPLYGDDMDAAAAEAAIAAGSEMRRLLEPVLDMIENAGSFEEIGEKLYEIYPEMESRRFQELLTRAMFAAGLTGYAGAGGEK